MTSALLALGLALAACAPASAPPAASSNNGRGPSSAAGTPGSAAASTNAASSGQEELISRGKPVFCSANDTGPGGPGTIVDGKYGTWGAWQVAVSALPGWCAIHVGGGPSRVLVTWASDYWYNYISDTGIGLGPSSYTLSVSSNSTTGADGTWRTAVTVTGNLTLTREHVIAFAGMSWIKMTVSAPMPHASAPNVTIDEVDVYDASAGANDTFFFAGDSITAMAYDRTEKHQPSFAELAHAAYPRRFPAMLDGGVGYMSLDMAVQRIDSWLAFNPDMRYWLVGWGGVDAMGNVSPEQFRANLQTLVDKIKAAGHVPVIAHIRYSTAPAPVGIDQEIQRLNTAVDQVVTANDLIAGPDLYALFRAHPDYLQPDGVHPNDAGSRAMNQAWFTALRPYLERGGLW